MNLKPVCEMLPHEIVEARDASSCAFVPVSPAFEWHSYHLPVGTDALIAEGICMHMAERVNGIYFRPLSFGLDSTRDKDRLAAWGFNEDAHIFGMRFPDLPLSSEYAAPDEMRRSIVNRLDAIQQSGFKHAFIVNQHGGAGQHATLEATGGSFKVHYVAAHRFITYRHDLMKVGGHAGQSETLLLMAFRPELVDLTQLPEGELEVRTTGILHDQPIIPESYHPGKTRVSVANRLRENLLDNFETFIRRTVKGTS